MKKGRSAVIAAVMTVFLIFGSISIFAASDFPDVTGTPFESAVTVLTEAGIINGYEDHTFRPYNSITRAEACTLIYKAYGDPSLAVFSDFNFNDVDDRLWAEPYINYCAGTGIVVGYPDGSFRPQANITYYEIITMLTRAQNLIGGTTPEWPAGYVALAADAGMLDNLSGVSFPDSGSLMANRGNTAIMICNTGHNKAPLTDPADDILADPETDCIAYGIVLTSEQRVDSMGVSCTTADFLMGSITYRVMADENNSGCLAGLTIDSGLVRLTVQGGRIAAAAPVVSAYDSASRTAGLLTPSARGVYDQMTHFSRIASVRTNRIMSTSDEGLQSLAFSNVVVAYCITSGEDGLTISPYSVNAIRYGDRVAAYTVNPESAGTIDVMLIVREGDAGSVLSGITTAGSGYL